jgi:hypothetical protein
MVPSISAVQTEDICSHAISNASNSYGRGEKFDPRVPLGLEKQ